jgi:hypothetical protein
MAVPVQKNFIRGPNLEMVRRPSAEGWICSFEAYKLASDRNRVLASNKRMSKAIIETDEWLSIRKMFPLWTGTMTAYVEPNTSFINSKLFSRNDNVLVYVDPDTSERWLFPLSNVPVGCVNEPTVSCLDAPNVILVTEHPLYSLEKVNGKDIIVTPQKVVGLSGFPTKNG